MFFFFYFFFLPTMHGNFIWSVVLMSYLYHTRIVMMSYLSYHAIIFQKLLMSSYCTCTHNGKARKYSQWRPSQSPCLLWAIGKNRLDLRFASLALSLRLFYNFERTCENALCLTQAFSSPYAYTGGELERQ